MSKVTPIKSAGQGLLPEDVELLVSAHLELLEAQASGVSVLGSTAGSELLAEAHRLAIEPVAELVPAALEVAA